MIARQVGLWGAMAAGAGAIGWAAAVPIAPREPSVALRRHAAAARAQPRVGQDSAAAALVRHAPFRAARKPAGIRYEAQRQFAPPPAPVPKPALLLVGVVLGPVSSAVIEGFPGVEGSRVVRAGDVVGDLRVAGINEQGVRILGMDTVWVLTVRKTWR